MFDAAFDAFWRDPKLLEQLMLLLLPKISSRSDKAVAPRANRLAEALAAPTRPKEPPNPADNSADEELEFDTSFAFSERERSQQADFESMTTAGFEFELAEKLAEELPLPVVPVRRRRHETAKNRQLGGRPSFSIRLTVNGRCRTAQLDQPAGRSATPLLGPEPRSAAKISIRSLLDDHAAAGKLGGGKTAAADQVRSLFADHDRGDIGVAARHMGHHRCVSDAQPIDPLDA